MDTVYPAQPVPQNEHPVYCYGIYPITDSQIVPSNVVLVSTQELADWTKEYLAKYFTHVHDGAWDNERTIAFEAKVKLSKQMILDHIEGMWGDELDND